MRTCIALCLCLWASAWVSAESDLTESNAVEIFRRESPQRRALQYELETSAALRRQAGFYPNPQVGWFQERTKAGGEATIESTLSVSLPLLVNGRYGLGRHVAQFHYLADQGLIERRSLELENHFREAFFDLLWNQERSQALREALAKFKTLAQTIYSRGRSDSYDLLRVNKEVFEIETRLKETQIAEAESRATLLRYLPQAASETFKVAGTLVPQDALASFDTYESRALSRSDLAALEARRQAHHTLGRTASRSWIPDLSVTAGPKTIDQPGENAKGYVAGLSLGIPLFDHGQALHQAESAREKSAHSEREALQREVQSALVAHYEAAVRYRVLWQDYERIAVRQAEQLERTVGLDYLEGRRTLLELLDGYAQNLETRLRRADLGMAARKADLALQRLAGTPMEKQP